MLIAASAMKVRQNFGELINQVQYCNAEVEITRNDKPVAVLISTELFDKIQLMRKEFDILTSDLQKSFKGQDQKEVEGLIDEALKRRCK
jgi:prevent-host-death family protein